MRVVAGALVLSAFVAAVAAYGAFGANIWRWGCPSDAERAKLRSPEEVVDAFDDHGVELTRVPLPRVLANGAPVYREAVLYRHSTASATAFVLVCKTRCAISHHQLNRPGGGVPAGQRWYIGVIGGNNVVLWITADDRRSGAEISNQTTPAVGDISGHVDPDSSCYIN